MTNEWLPDTSSWPIVGVQNRNAYRLSGQVVDMRRSERSKRPIEVPAQPQRLILDLSRAAIIIVDMQNDFCHPDGWIAGLGVDTSAARGLAPSINGTTSSLRGANVPIIWLTWGSGQIS